MNIVLFLICLFACLIGSISGLGGGLIIKPLVDSFGTIGIDTIGFLSNCTVITMLIISIYKNRKTKISLNIFLPICLGIGASLGGVIGKIIFNQMIEIFDNNIVARIQYTILFVMNILILIYIMNKNKIKTKQLKSKIVSILFGVFLGVSGSFLSIGGGPINIVVLYYFYSLQPREASISSLIIIAFSQITGLITTLINGVPEFEPMNLLVMCIGAVCGALIGGFFLKRMDNKKSHSFFIKVLILLIILNLYNMLKFFDVLNI